MSKDKSKKDKGKKGKGKGKGAKKDGSPEPRMQSIAFRQGMITLRPMGRKDRKQMLAFARELPEHDRLFLRRDLTDPKVLEEWLELIRDGALSAIVAVDAGRILGYATVQRYDEAWSTHVAEVRVSVAPDARGSGLGSRLVNEVFKLALVAGVEKMVARMTPDQKGAIATFEGLGFRPEGVLREHVRDRQGTKHDLLVLGHDVRAVRASLESYGVADALQ